MKGDSVSGLGHYGVRGVPALTNNPPARYNPGSWTDTAGNFWIYGGGNSSRLSDLWKFDPNSLMWTWINGNQGYVYNDTPIITGNKGIYTSQNRPGELGWGFNVWVTSDNHFWFFGGAGGGGTNSDKLWQYDPQINQWAWMGTFGPPHYGVLGIGDSTTMPGGRSEGNTCWVDDAGNLWLFGGAEWHNDLWKYNKVTGIWTWMGGSSSNSFNSGVYISKGSAYTTEYPSGRDNDMFWKDSNGNFWLAGGQYSNANKFWQDVWQFNPRTLEWIWMDGPSVSDTSHPIALECDTDYRDDFGARWENRATWKYCDDLILTYGGFWNWPTHYNVNDLWAYIPSKNHWIKITETPTVGHYGIQGVPNPQNVPSFRFGAVSFIDRQRNLWLFSGYSSSNDLWRYQLDTSCPEIKGCLPITSFHVQPNVTNSACSATCNGSATLVTSNGTPPYHYMWSLNHDTSATLSNLCAGNYIVSITDASGLIIIDTIVINISPLTHDSIIVHGDSLLVSNATNCQWYLNGQKINGATSYYYIEKTPGSYTVTYTDSSGCTVTSSQALISGMDDIDNDRLAVYPNPLYSGSWICLFSNSLIGAQLEVYDNSGRQVYIDRIVSSKTQLEFICPQGIYVLKVTYSRGSIVKKLVRL